MGGCSACPREIANSRSRDDGLSVTKSVASGSIIPQLELGGEAAIMVISSKEPLVFLPRYLCTSPPRVVVRWLERHGRGEEEEKETSYDSLVRGFWLIDDAKL